MRLLITVFSCLALVVSSTFAKLPLPDGYWITNVTDLGADKTSESRGNPYSPLLNATLTCYKENHPTFLWRNYELWGSGWYGAIEKSIKFAAANANSCMTKWKFETWNDTGCFRNADGPTDCVENMPVWHAKVSLSSGHRLTAFLIPTATLHSAHTDYFAVPPLAYHGLAGCHDGELRKADWGIRQKVEVSGRLDNVKQDPREAR